MFRQLPVASCQLPVASCRGLSHMTSILGSCHLCWLSILGSCHLCWLLEAEGGMFALCSVCVVVKPGLYRRGVGRGQCGDDGPVAVDPRGPSRLHAGGPQVWQLNVCTNQPLGPRLASCQWTPGLNTKPHHDHIRRLFPRSIRTEKLASCQWHMRSC